MRKPFIAGNMKMHKTVSEALSYAKSLKELVKNVSDRDILVCAPMTALYALSQELSGSNIKLGAQNVMYEDKGAFTGEIAPGMLKEIGVEYVIIGHSERRHVFKETDDVIQRKVKKCLETGLLPILCVGEQLEQREAGITNNIVGGQVFYGLCGLNSDEVKKVTIAYEPVWAIGTGKVATPNDAQAVHKYIRTLLGEVYDSATADAVRIQYGGSVKPDNVAGLMDQPDIDGALVGGACLEADSFSKLIKY